MCKKSIISFSMVTLCLAVTMVGCSGPIIVTSPVEKTSTPSQIAYAIQPSITPTPLPDTNVPAGSNEVQPPIEAKNHLPLTVEDVKNVEPSKKIAVDSSGVLTGLPEGTSQEKMDAVTNYYQAIQKKFPTSNVYYAEDPASGQWLLYATLGGNLFYETYSYGGGPEQYFDYPLSYNQFESGLSVTGNYELVAIPGEVGVIWKNGLPQFLAERTKTVSGDTYFTEYLDYISYVADAKPWKEIAGISNLEIDKASDIWQISPDGHIAYNEAELYGGLFTINKEHPEYLEKYWEDTVRGLWNINWVAKKTAFVNKFTSADSLIDYLMNGGGPVDNLWIPVIYPNGSRLYQNQATLVPIDGHVDLSQIEISIYKPTNQEIYTYSPSYATGTKYISYLGAAGEALIEKVNLNGKDVLKITLRRDLLTDTTRPLSVDNDASDTRSFTILAITDEKTDTENLLAVTQLLRSWPLHMQIKDTSYSQAWLTNSKPPRINFNSIWPIFQDYAEITNLDEVPLVIRH